MRRIVPFFPIVALLLPGEAVAHAHLKSSSPVDGGVLTTDAQEIILTFDALINEAMCSAVDASGAKAPGLGMATFVREKVHVPLSGALKAGPYVLTCKVKSDRHETDHAIKFTVP